MDRPAAQQLVAKLAERVGVGELRELLRQLEHAGDEVAAALDAHLRASEAGAGPGAHPPRVLRPKETP